MSEVTAARMTREQAVSEPTGMPSAGRALLRVFERLRHGRLELVTPAGERMVFGGDPGPEARLHLRDWAAAAAILRTGDIGLGESYIDGSCDIDRPADLLGLAVLNASQIERAFYGQWAPVLWQRLRHLLRANTRAGSRRNILAHYDLGNDFYRLWLDPTMTYSAAWFGDDPSASLEAAQHAKYARILDRLQARPGQRILEIGCGWGGFAEAAARRGVEVHGITISRAQLEFARARLAAAGLSERARLSFVDYRDVTGTYDHVVSIEMVEAVGERYWPAYFRTIRDRLAPGGRALIQAITIDGTAWPRYRSGTDFIQRHVFPGGMLPSVEVLREQASAAGLAERGCTGFGLDYAETLRRWLGAVSAAEPKVRELGFDERFLRLWRFYLAYCEAGFAHGRTDVVHFELARPQ